MPLERSWSLLESFCDDLRRMCAILKTGVDLERPRDFRSCPGGVSVGVQVFRGVEGAFHVLCGDGGVLDCVLSDVINQKADGTLCGDGVTSASSSATSATFIDVVGSWLSSYSPSCSPRKRLCGLRLRHVR